MPSELTQRQREIVDFLRSEHSRSGIMPSTRELQKHFGFASQTAAVSHLRALEKKGLVQRMPGKARAVVLTEVLDRAELVDIPIYGQIAAGMPGEAVQEDEGTMTLDVFTLGIRPGSQSFALKVRGMSMIDAHICPGDTVVLERRRPHNNDIVAALIDGETTLKRFIDQGGETFLRAENEDYPDLTPVHGLEIQGVMVGLIRKV